MPSTAGPTTTRGSHADIGCTDDLTTHDLRAYDHLSASGAEPNRRWVVSDPASVNEDESLLINVLANDLDPEGQALIIAAVGTPIHGTAVLEAGQHPLPAGVNFSGTDQFVYTATDGVNAPVSGRSR